jgi:hypothetical protein
MKTSLFPHSAFPFFLFAVFVLVDECNVEDMGVVSDSSEEQINESKFLEFSDSTTFDNMYLTKIV